VYALDARTGDDLWSYSFDQPVESSPTVVNGVMYVGRSYPGILYAFSLKNGVEGAEVVSRRPQPHMLRPDLNLKVFTPGAAASAD
jgi:outer membrane protein assembly factor BamB